MLQVEKELFPDSVKLVGPILTNNFNVQAIIEALQELNPELRLVARGPYIKAFAPNRCILSRHLVERYLGRSFSLPQDLEANMPSFSGRFYVIHDEAFWVS